MSPIKPSQVKTRPVTAEGRCARGGALLAAGAVSVREDGVYLVQGRRALYEVRPSTSTAPASCSCPDHVYRLARHGERCAHLWACYLSVVVGDHRARVARGGAVRPSSAPTIRQSSRELGRVTRAHHEANAARCGTQAGPASTAR